MLAGRLRLRANSNSNCAGAHKRDAPKALQAIGKRTWSGARTGVVSSRSFSPPTAALWPAPAVAKLKRSLKRLPRPEILGLLPLRGRETPNKRGASGSLPFPGCGRRPLNMLIIICGFIVITVFRFAEIGYVIYFSEEKTERWGGASR